MSEVEESAKSSKRKRSCFEDDDVFDDEISCEIREITSALHQIREKAENDGQKQKEEMISSVTAEIKSMFEELKAKIEHDRQKFAHAFSKSSKEFENAMQEEVLRLQAVNERSSKEKASCIKSLEDILLKFEDELEWLSMQYLQQRKKENSMIQEKEKMCTTKIAELEESLKKKKQGILRC